MAAWGLCRPVGDMGSQEGAERHYSAVASNREGPSLSQLRRRSGTIAKFRGISKTATAPRGKVPVTRLLSNWQPFPYSDISMIL